MSVLDIAKDFGTILKSFLQEETELSQPSTSNTGNIMKNNIFAGIISFFEDFSIGTAATTFWQVHPNIVRLIQQEVHKQNQQNEPIGGKIDMNFTLDKGDTDSADDDSNSLDIVISDNTSHQSQQKKLFLQSSLKDLEASRSISKLKPTPVAKEKKTKNVKDTEKRHRI
ncbi:hypothetical protein RhiirA1_472880 [Rhizophagus irregularis]|uniref:Uncharacterized protein n=1 Tax=Rhizophagus irregularis TaxID=588596 RepID=A0A2N0R1L5_9GLOM|nr:hypothetical protein RhiirA1_472880 [Rhizophagus irregularis]